MISHPSYPGRGSSVGDAIERLRRFRESGDHAFWPDSVSLCEEGRLRPERLTGHRQVTVIYLLALAVERGGRLVTFDRRIRADAVAGGTPRLLEVLGAPA